MTSSLRSETSKALLRAMVAAAASSLHFACGGAGDPPQPVDATINALCLLEYPNACSSGLWPGGVVPFAFDPALPHDRKDNVWAAMYEWGNALEHVVTFRAKESGDAHYVYFSAQPGCGGSMRSDPVVNYPAGDCGRLSGSTITTIKVPGRDLHEMGHLLGFEHTQNRTDRDRYLRTSSIDYLQAQPMCRNDSNGNPVVGEPVTKCKPNSPFPTAGDGPGGTFGLFDYNSIMLYGSTGGYTPTSCDLDGVAGGDWFRRMVKRGPSTAGLPPCPADIAGDWSTTRITKHDSASLIEIYRTKNSWAPSTAMGRDEGAQKPLNFALAPNVYARGNPAVASLGGSAGSIVTAVRGSDGNVYVALTSGSGAGASWTSVGKPGTVLLGDPALVSWTQSSARIDLVIVAKASSSSATKIYKKAYVSRAWETTWDTSMGMPAGATLKGGIAVASWGSDRLDIFVNDDSKRMWHQSWSSSGYGGWDQPGGIHPGGQMQRPAAVSWGAGRIDIVTRAADGNIWHFWWDNNAWAPAWTSIGNGNSNYDPTIASFGTGRLEIYNRGPNDRLYQRACTSGDCKAASSWSGLVPLGTIMKSSPAAASPRGFQRVDVVAVGEDGSALPTATSEGGMWHKWWPWN